MKEKQPIHTIQLIQNTFSTLLLDAIQYFPANKKRTQGETHGLFFGLEKDPGVIECDYIFPVGNVKLRTADTIENDPKIDNAIMNARSLLATSKYLGTYHSHPNIEYFPEWAWPSNTDVAFMQHNKDPYMIIIALTRIGKGNQPLHIEFHTDQAFSFLYNNKKDIHEFPDYTELKQEVRYICGAFQEYTFEIRAYSFDGMALHHANLISSEAELLGQLKDNVIDVASLSTAEVFRLRKVEFNLRENNERREKNTEYHLQRLKGSNTVV